MILNNLRTMGSKNKLLKDGPINQIGSEKNQKNREDSISREDLMGRRALVSKQESISPEDPISRRDFSSKLLKTGLGLAAAGIFPSYI